MTSNNCYPILYYDEISPQARSCLMVLRMLNINIHLQYVDMLKGEHLTPKYDLINTTHSIPTLVHGNYFTLTDSHSILIYLCELCGQQDQCARRLFPCYLHQRAKIINYMFFENSVLFRRYCDFMGNILRENSSEADMDMHRKKMSSAYELLNEYLRNKNFLMGEQVTIADISMVATVGALDLTFPVKEGKVKWPSLHCWFERMRRIPAYSLNYTGLEKQRMLLHMMGKVEIPLTLNADTINAVFSVGEVYNSNCSFPQSETKQQQLEDGQASLNADSKKTIVTMRNSKSNANMEQRQSNTTSVGATDANGSSSEEEKLLRIEEATKSTESVLPSNSVPSSPQENRSGYFKSNESVLPSNTAQNSAKEIRSGSLKSKETVLPSSSEQNSAKQIGSGQPDKQKTTSIEQNIDTDLKVDHSRSLIISAQLQFIKNSIYEKADNPLDEAELYARIQKPNITSSRSKFMPFKKFNSKAKIGSKTVSVQSSVTALQNMDLRSKQTTENETHSLATYANVNDGKETKLNRDVYIKDAAATTSYETGESKPCMRTPSDSSAITQPLQNNGNDDNANSLNGLPIYASISCMPTDTKSTETGCDANELHTKATLAHMQHDANDCRNLSSQVLFKSRDAMRISRSDSAIVKSKDGETVSTATATQQPTEMPNDLSRNQNSKVTTMSLLEAELLRSSFNNNNNIVEKTFKALHNSVVDVTNEQAAAEATNLIHNDFVRYKGGLSQHTAQRRNFSTQTKHTTRRHVENTTDAHRKVTSLSTDVQTEPVLQTNSRTKGPKISKLRSRTNISKFSRVGSAIAAKQCKAQEGQTAEKPMEFAVMSRRQFEEIEYSSAASTASTTTVTLKDDSSVKQMGNFKGSMCSLTDSSLLAVKNEPKEQTFMTENMMALSSTSVSSSCKCLTQTAAREALPVKRQWSVISLLNLFIKFKQYIGEYINGMEYKMVHMQDFELEKGRQHCISMLLMPSISDAVGWLEKQQQDEDNSSQFEMPLRQNFAYALNDLACKKDKHSLSSATKMQSDTSVSESDNMLQVEEKEKEVSRHSQLQQQWQQQQQHSSAVRLDQLIVNHCLCISENETKCECSNSSMQQNSCAMLMSKTCSGQKLKQNKPKTNYESRFNLQLNGCDLRNLNNLELQHGSGLENNAACSEQIGNFSLNLNTCKANIGSCNGCKTKKSIATTSTPYMNLRMHQHTMASTTEEKSANAKLKKKKIKSKTEHRNGLCSPATTTNSRCSFKTKWRQY